MPEDRSHAVAVEPDRAARAETLRLLLFSGIALLTVATLFSLAVNRERPTIRTNLLMIGGHLIAYALLRAGRLLTAISVHTALYLLIVIYTMYLYGGIRAPVGFVLPPIVLLVGLTWNGRAAIVTAVAASFALLALVVAEGRGFLPPAQAPPSSRAIWIVATTALVITSVILALALRTIAAHRAKAQAAEQQRRDLEGHIGRMRRLEIVGRLAAGVAHDFNNMLTVILGHGGALAQSSDPEVAARARPIEDAAKHAAALNQTLLAIGRQQRIEPRDLDLNQSILTLEGLLRRSSGTAERLSFDLSTEPLMLRADPTQIEQILLNLVGNAADATRSGGAVVVRTRRVDSDPLLAVPGWRWRGAAAAVIEVIDTGTGIRDDVKSRLFEPFFTTKEPGHGTGLGLASVFGIVEQNEGAIAVTSALGRGTTFSIYLPLAAPAS